MYGAEDSTNFAQRLLPNLGPQALSGHNFCAISMSFYLLLTCWLGEVDDYKVRVGGAPLHADGPATMALLAARESWLASAPCTGLPLSGGDEA